MRHLSCKDHLGNQFTTQKEMCSFWGVSLSTFTRKKRQGYPLNECLASKRSIFYDKLKQIHGDSITVLSEYAGSHDKVLVHCNICGHEWKATPTVLVRKKHSGCPECGNKAAKEKCTKSHDEWISEIDNSKVIVRGTYKGSTHKILVRCTNPSCGHEWYARPYDIVRGKGCSRCQYIQKSHDYTMSEAEFERKLIEEHHSTIKCLSKFHGVNYKYDFKCMVCGNVWSTVANSIINANKTGCPHCKESNYEKTVREYLNQNAISFSTQFVFPDCLSSGGNPSRFDFSIPDIGVIEVDGEGHFRQTSNWNFQRTVENDNLKTAYCENNHIPLLRIRYDQIQDGTYVNLIEDFINNPAVYIMKHNKYLSEVDYYSERTEIF